ncbi:amino acid ABC transporter permease [Patulibacter minatonensis]|uniref:amino acid ABC transporter permease n=1 Tax=Patulibacter minatonensis TaxID=298163 RepID=UPI00055B1863|nr:amino acid ABC transporter permease [Patulibacter minatonensis]
MATSPTSPASDAGDIKAVPVRHYGRWLFALIVLVFVASLLSSAIRNDNFKWDVVGDYLFADRVLRGLWLTIWLSTVAVVLGIALGTLLAVMRLSDNPVLRWVSLAYIWFFRGTPVYVQLLGWSFIGALYSTISFGVPFGGPVLVSANGNDLITPITAAILGLGLNLAAYQAEIVRAGLLSVDEGQVESAKALGMTGAQSMRRIVLPQAMRVIIPPTGNQAIDMLKTSSLVATIGVADLLYSVQLIYAQNYQQVPLLVAACIWYLLMTSILSIGQYYLERHYAAGNVRELPPTPLQRARARAASVRFGGPGNPG